MKSFSHVIPHHTKTELFLRRPGNQRACMSKDNLKLICSFLNSSRREAIYGISKRAWMFYFQLECNNARIAWKFFILFLSVLCAFGLYCVNICHSYQIVACYGFLTPSLLWGYVFKELLPIHWIHGEIGWIWKVIESGSSSLYVNS